MQVLRARVSAGDARRKEFDAREADVARVKEELKRAQGGVSGVVAASLRRSRAMLRGALGEGAAAAHDVDE